MATIVISRLSPGTTHCQDKAPPYASDASPTCSEAAIPLLAYCCVGAPWAHFHTAGSQWSTFGGRTGGTTARRRPPHSTPQRVNPMEPSAFGREANNISDVCTPSILTFLPLRAAFTRVRPSRRVGCEADVPAPARAGEGGGRKALPHPSGRHSGAAPVSSSTAAGRMRMAPRCALFSSSNLSGRRLSRGRRRHKDHVATSSRPKCLAEI